MTSCGPRWHRLGLSDDEVTWFRLATRMRDAQGTYIFRVGPERDDSQCRTIWCYGDNGVPWICQACGKRIGE